MPAYRLYFTNRDGHIGRALELECGDDAAAVAAASRHATGARMELWDRARIVEIFEPQTESARAA